jgi:hypothetical protein
VADDAGQAQGGLGDAILGEPAPQQGQASGTMLGMLFGLRAVLDTARGMVDAMIRAHSPPEPGAGQQAGQANGGKRPQATFGANRASRGG